MSCGRLSLLTNVTWVPRGTTIVAGLTVLLAIVTVVALTGLPGVVDGDVLLPPHPTITAAVASPQTIVVRVLMIGSSRKRSARYVARSLDQLHTQWFNRFDISPNSTRARAG